MAILREWECPECGLVFRGHHPPDECPGCGEPFYDLAVYDLTDADDWLEDDEDDLDEDALEDGPFAPVGDLLEDLESDDALDALRAELGL